MIDDKKIVKVDRDIYEIAKNEAISLGRMKSDKKDEIKEIGPDGQILVPEVKYVDIGGLGSNSNKSFWTNIPNSKSFISFDLAVSSYKGETLTNHLTEFDPDFRNIVYNLISKKSLADFDGSKGKKLLLKDIKNEFNSYLIKKDLDPIVYAVHYKVFAIVQR